MVEIRSLFIQAAFALSIVYACTANAQSGANGNQAMLTSTINLNVEAGSVSAINGLSGLAWDEDEQLLYAISDFGELMHFSIDVGEDRINKVTLIKALPLLDEKGNAVDGKDSDAEGLDVVGDNNGIIGDSYLLVSFERKHRIVAYSTSGRWVRNILENRRLLDKNSYRSANKSLESVLDHPQLGIITAPEIPLSDQDDRVHKIYLASDKIDQDMAVSRMNEGKASLTDMENMSNGDVLIIERNFENVFSPFQIVLKRIRVSTCDPEGMCESETLLELDSSRYPNLDNYEGLTSIGKGRYLMVSDNNGSVLQQTLLSLLIVNE